MASFDVRLQVLLQLAHVFVLFLVSSLVVLLEVLDQLDLRIHVHLAFVRQVQASCQVQDLELLVVGCCDLHVKQSVGLWLGSIKSTERLKEVIDDVSLGLWIFRHLDHLDWHLIWHSEIDDGGASELVTVVVVDTACHQFHVSFVLVYCSEVDDGNSSLYWK